MFRIRDLFRSAQERTPGDFFNNIPGVGPEIDPNPPAMPGVMGEGPGEPEPDADSDDTFAAWMGREGELNGRPPRPRKIF